MSQNRNPIKTMTGILMLVLGVFFIVNCFSTTSSPLRIVFAMLGFLSITGGYIIYLSTKSNRE